jgi:hypothetical protein
MIVELLLDKYYFGDIKYDCDNQFILDGVRYVEEAINMDMPEIDKEMIVNILGVLRFVAKRRTRTGREYMDIVHQYVGQRVATGIRIMP